MEVEQMQHCEIRNKHRVERAIIMQELERECGR